MPRKPDFEVKGKSVRFEPGMPVERSYDVVYIDETPMIFLEDKGFVKVRDPEDVDWADTIRLTIKTAGGGEVIGYEYGLKSPSGVICRGYREENRFVYGSVVCEEIGS